MRTKLTKKKKGKMVGNATAMLEELSTSSHYLGEAAT